LISWRSLKAGWDRIRLLSLKEVAELRRERRSEDRNVKLRNLDSVSKFTQKQTINRKLDLVSKFTQKQTINRKLDLVSKFTQKQTINRKLDFVSKFTQKQTINRKLE
jgi:hypothetical protein